MGVVFGVVYHELVVKEDMPRLATADKARIKRAIEEKLMSEPEVFGKPLRCSLKGYRKLRVGDCRVIFKIREETVKILYIGHRLVVYRDVEKRI